MRQVLLDTSILLWASVNSTELPTSFREALASESAAYYYHQTSIWEIEIKFGLGKLALPGTPEEFFADIVRQTSFQRRSIRDEAIFLLKKLPPIHRDPFDRLLIAYAILEGWEFMTVDSNIMRYPVKLFPGVGN